MILNRNQAILDPLLPTKENGFRPGRFTTAQNPGAKKNC